MIFVKAFAVIERDVRRILLSLDQTPYFFLLFWRVRRVLFDCLQTLFDGVGYVACLGVALLNDLFACLKG